MDHYAPHFITHVVFAQRGMVTKNPALIARFLKSFFASIAYMTAHKAETAALAEKVLHQDAKVVGEDADFEGPMFIADGRFDPEAVAVLKKSFVDMGTLPSAPSDDAMFTTQFVPVKY
jgi:ABC-type nitrate/sulfonate/bicarbonate transport system substrate-binding protein